MKTYHMYMRHVLFKFCCRLRNNKNEIAAPFLALPDFFIFLNGVPATAVVISFAKIVEYQQNRTMGVSIAASPVVAVASYWR